MIGQQKRLLDRTASSKPVKYQKHSDDKKLCDSHTRVASLTDEKLEFEQRYAGVSQKSTFSVSPGGGCDSMKAFDRVLASEIPMPQKENDTLEPEVKACCGPNDAPILLDDCEALRTVDDPPTQSAEAAATVDGHDESTGHSFDRDSKIHDSGRLGTPELTRDAGLPPSSGSGASVNEECGEKKWQVLGSSSREIAVELCEDEQVGLSQGAEGPGVPGTAENHVEGGAYLEADEETVHIRSTYDSSDLPVLLREKVVDLHMMDDHVRRCGGYEVVTSEGLWSSISQELGLGSDCGPGLKLIYFNYVRTLQRERGECHHDNDFIDSVHTRGQRLRDENGFLDEKGEDCSFTDSEQFAESQPQHERLGEQPENGRSSSNISRDDHLEVDDSEDETEIGSIKSEGESAKIHHAEHRTPNCSFARQCMDLPEAYLSDHKVFKGYFDHHGFRPVRQKGELEAHVEEEAVSDVAAKERLKQSLNDTLTWIKRMAAEPGNPQKGQGPEGTWQDEKWTSESQAQKIRALLWRRRDDVMSSVGHSHQARQQTPPPSAYYEDPIRQEQHSSDRARGRREHAAVHYESTTNSRKPFKESVHFQRRASPSFNNQTQWFGQTSQRLSRQHHHYYSEDWYPEELLHRPRKKVPVGEYFQAHILNSRPVDHIPSSGVGASGTAGPSGDETQSSDDNDEEDDTRWLGKQVWPPPGSNQRSASKGDHFIGHGRPSICSCLHPESLNCVRLHIEEERARLKQELGQAFYIWKFDQTGESVAEEWTRDEQYTFQHLVKLNPASRGKNFWNQLPIAFPGKKMRDLVSYYFNVFVLRRRAIQNRVNAQHVDSDDDETYYPECESEDSSDYDSGDEGDEEEEYPDASDEEDETDKEEDRPYASDCSAKQLGDHSFVDFGSFSRKIGDICALDEAQDVSTPMTVRTARLLNMENVEEDYHDPHQDQGDARLHLADMTAKWSRHDDDEKHHLDENHISIVGEEDLQEVKTWEASHWDEEHHDDLAKCISSRGEPTPLERVTSPSYKKSEDETNQQSSSLVGSQDGEVWGPTTDIDHINKPDKLLSTNGMIQEFFGNEASSLNAST